MKSLQVTKANKKNKSRSEAGEDYSPAVLVVNLRRGRVLTSFNNVGIQKRKFSKF